MSGVSEEQARAWAGGHDAASLSSIVAHRTMLLEALDADPGLSGHALALARLIDLEGASAELRTALMSSAKQAKGTSDEARLRLSLAQLDFEEGDLAGAELHVQEAIEIADRIGESEVGCSARLALVKLLFLDGGSTEAEALFSKVEAQIDEEQWPWLKCAAELLRAGLMMRSARKLDARPSMESALQRALGYGGAVEASLAAGMLGNLEQDVGDLEAANRWLKVAIAQAQEAASRSVEAIFTGYRAWVLQELSRERQALSLYRKAIGGAEELAMPRFAAQFAALRATLGVSARNAAQRELNLSKALGELAATGDRERAEALAPLRALIEARRAGWAEPGVRLAPLFRAIAIARRAKPSSDDGRIALRMANAAIEQAIERCAGDESELSVTLGAGCLEIDGHRHSIRQQAPRTILWELIEGWIDDRHSSGQELIDAAWPGEKLIPTSASHRLHVAISTLRKAGLGDRLVRDKGYHLRVGSISLLSPTIENN